MRVIAVIALFGLASASQFTCPQFSQQAGSWSPEYFGDCKCNTGYEKNANNDACQLIPVSPTNAPTKAPTAFPTQQTGSPTKTPTPSPTEQENDEDSNNSWGEDGGTEGKGATGCFGTGAWLNDPNMATWCTANCNHYFPYCPSSMCSCVGRRRLSGATFESSSRVPSASAPRSLGAIKVGQHDKKKCMKWKASTKKWVFHDKCRAPKGQAKCQLGYNLRYHWNNKLWFTWEVPTGQWYYKYSCYKGMCAGQTEFSVAADATYPQGDSITVSLNSETRFAMCEMFRQMADDKDEITETAFLGHMGRSNQPIRKSDAKRTFKSIKREYAGDSSKITKMDWAHYMSNFQSADSSQPQEITATSSSSKSSTTAIVGAVAGVAMVVGVAVVVTRRSADAAKSKEENELQIALGETEL